MKRIFFAVTIFIALAAAVLVLPAFNLKVSTRELEFPEIGLSYRNSAEYKDSVAAHIVLNLQEGGDSSLKARQTAEMVKQRLELMEITNAEVSSYEQEGYQIIRVKLPDDGEITDKRIKALTTWEKIQVYNSAPPVETEDGAEASEQDSGLGLSDLDYDFAKGASLSFDPNTGSYVIKVDFDKSQLDAVTTIATSSSAAAFSGDTPVAIVNSQFTPTKPTIEFTPISGENREEALITLAELGTRPYPVEVQLISQEKILAEEDSSNLLVFAGTFILIYLVTLGFFYFNSKKLLNFLAISLFIFSVITLVLFKAEVFGAEITLNLLIGFISAYILATLSFYFLAEKVKARVDELSSQSRVKVFGKTFKQANKDLRFLFLFLLFLLVVLRGFHSSFYSEFADGFGFGVVTLLVISVFFLKSLFVNLYLEPINIKNVFKGNSKK